MLFVLGANLAVAKQSFGRRGDSTVSSDKESFLDALVSNMTVEDMGQSILKYSRAIGFISNFTEVLQMHLMFSGDIVGIEGKNELYGMCCTSELHFLTNFILRLYNEVQSRLTNRSRS